MGGTIIHTISKDAVSGTGEGKGIGHYGPRTRRKKKPTTDPTKPLHWRAYRSKNANPQQLLKRQTETVEALVALLKETLESRTARHGLSLDSAEFTAKQAGYTGGKEITKAVDRAGACLAARMPHKYMFKGDLVLAKKP